MNILITGGNGFLGSALAKKLLSLGHNIFLLIRKVSLIKRVNAEQDNLTIIRYQTDDDIRNSILLISPDIIIHTACCYGRNGESFLEIYDANFRFGAVILNAINCSEKETIFLNTATSLSPNINYYSASKNQFSELGYTVSRLSSGKIKFIDIVLEHMYGANDDTSKFISHVINACKYNKPFLKLTYGEQLRDFIYIEDVVNAYSFIIDNISKIENNERIQLGSGKVISIRELVLLIHKLFKSTTILQFGDVPYRKDEVMYSRANLTYLNNIGWSPKFDIATGITETIKLETI